jgi:16S rRNA processing protein RimM
MVPARDAIVVLGEVAGSYGVRGWLRVRPHSEAPETLLGFATWWLKPARGGEWREFTRLDGRMHSGTLLAALDGVETREAALLVKGFVVGVPRTALPVAGNDEVYWDDLTGLAVLNRGGVVLGVVAGMTEHGAHPLLRVTRPSGMPGPERLIPYVPAIVDRVDVGAGRIEVDWGEDF